jgi:hypothetical protein
MGFEVVDLELVGFLLVVELELVGFLLGEMVEELELKGMRLGRGSGMLVLEMENPLDSPLEQGNSVTLLEGVLVEMEVLLEEVLAGMEAPLVGGKAAVEIPLVEVLVGQVTPVVLEE